MKKQHLSSFLDFVAYTSKRNIPLLVATLVDTFILIYAFANISKLTEEPSWLVLTMAICTEYLWQLYNVYTHFRDALKKVDYDDSGTSIVSIKDKRGQYTLNQNVSDAYSAMQDIPDYIVPNDLAFIDSKEPIVTTVDKDKPRDLDNMINSLWPILSVFLNEKYHRIANFRNESKLCLASEFAFYDNCWHASICKGNYYNSYITNGIYNSYLMKSGVGTLFYHPYNATNCEITSLDHSIMSNHIGVSTLILSKDNQICLLAQQKDAAFNSMKIMPTGSGSVDYADANGLTDLRKIIINAAERELQEESSFDAEQARKNGLDVQTTLIGFYRDLSRGGKPEFCCVTKVPVHHKEISIKPCGSEQWTLHHNFYAIDALINDQIDLDKKFKRSNTLMANLYFLKKYLEKKHS